jgi:hypothetical protein
MTHAQEQDFDAAVAPAHGLRGIPANPQRVSIRAASPAKNQSPRDNAIPFITII